MRKCNNNDKYGNVGKVAFIGRAKKSYRDVSEHPKDFSRVPGDLRGVSRDSQCVSVDIRRSLGRLIKLNGISGGRKEFQWAPGGIRCVLGVSGAFQEIQRGFRGYLEV